MAEFNGVGNAAPFFHHPFHYYIITLLHYYIITMFHILLSFMMIEPTKATVVNAAHPLKAYAPIVTIHCLV
jgi:hypothetical protein